MKTLRYFLFVFFMFTLFSCDNNDTEVDDGLSLWKPILTVSNDANEITVAFSTSYGGFCGTGIASPDYLELFYSDNPASDFKSLARTNPGEGVYWHTIPNLVNGKDYYFCVIAFSKKYPSVSSDIIKATPDRAESHIDNDSVTYLYNKPIEKVKKELMGISWKLDSPVTHDYLPKDMYYEFDDDFLYIKRENEETITDRLEWLKIRSRLLNKQACAYVQNLRNEMILFSLQNDTLIIKDDILGTIYKFERIKNEE